MTKKLLNMRTHAVMIALLLLGTLTLALEIQHVKAEEQLQYIYITEDGSVDPPKPYIQRDGNVYTLTSDAEKGWGIRILRDNITLDGAGYTVWGLEPPNPIIGAGINLTGRSNVMIENVQIRRFQVGILLNDSSDSQLYHNWLYDGNNTDPRSVGIKLLNSSYNTLFNNTVESYATYKGYHWGIFLNYSSNNRVFNCTADDNGSYWNGWGIRLDYSSYNDVFDNIANFNHDGVGLGYSHNNSILYNRITNNGEGAGKPNGEGIGLSHSNNNTLKRNNVIANERQFNLVDSYDNTWDGGYPYGGNYWSDYWLRYPNATELDNSGIWDTPYVIDAETDNVDYYPFMEPLEYTYKYLTVDAGLGGTTDLVPGAYPIVNGSEVTVTAFPWWGYEFSNWTLDGEYNYDNPITVTMDSNHTLKAWFEGGSEPCPTLFSWNGTHYVDLGVIDIHAQEDVVKETTVATENVAVNNLKAKFRLQEGWEGLNWSHSEIDQVKLYAVDSEGTWLLCPLIKARHSEHGNVLLRLLVSDDWKIDIYLLETIDLKFIVPYPTDDIENYVFVIEGRNIIKM